MASILAGITIVFAIGWCATALLYRASAALRHLVWTCAFGAALVLAPLRWQVPHHMIAPAIPALAVMAPVRVITAAPAARGANIDWATIVLAVWITGTMILLLRLLLNAIRMRAVVRAAEGRAPVLRSSRVPGPLAAGLLRPVILLPDSADTWTPARRRAVLAHEAAHIRRRDPAILLAAHIATAVYWFHPLCWLAASRMRAESERACDDAALRTGLLPSGYATDLLDLARMFDTQLAIPMATTSHLESRVKSILDPFTNRSFPARATWFAAIALTAALVAPLTTFTLRAQQPGGGAITGTVSDPTGAVVPRATVAAINQAGIKETTVSNAVGAYSFSAMAPGSYTIEVQAPGFANFRVDNVAPPPDGKVQADVRLTVGGLSERITVAAQGAPPTAAPAVASNGRPIRVGGMVQAATLIQQVKPVYPGFLQAQGIEGTVVLSAVISKQGVPTSLKVLKRPSNEEFVTAAMSAVEQWQYQPPRLNGEPIEVLTTIQVDFKLSATATVIDDRIILNNLK
jgi:TonB family protein